MILGVPWWWFVVAMVIGGLVSRSTVWFFFWFTVYRIEDKQQRQIDALMRRRIS